ncbi:MAG: hypothetical protein HQL32_04255 [Planctomycetes bacterium]|nr:hypothetical protein [Planctomycetota bacterium]
MKKQMAFKLEPELVKRAKEAIGADTMTDAVITALEEMVSREETFSFHKSIFGSCKDFGEK